jgi:hypothetical protein
MKPEIKTILLPILLAGIVVFLAGCGKQPQQPVQLDQGWSSPVKIAESQEGDVRGGVDVYKWRDTIFLLQQRYDWHLKSSTCSIMTRYGQPSNSWIQLPLSEVPESSRFIYSFFGSPAIDQASGRIMFDYGYIENDQLLMGAKFVRMTADNRIQVEPEKKWTRDQESLFGKTDTNVHLNGPAVRPDRPNRDYPSLGMGILNGSELYIPFCLTGDTEAPNARERGPFYNGVFHSADAGVTWQMDRISDFEARLPALYRTKDYNYYFATGKLGTNYGTIWFSRKPNEGSSWSKPEALTESFVSNSDGQYVAMTEGEAVHICWTDRRHGKEKLEIGVFPPHMYRELKNYEIAYRHRKDSDADWSKDVILSEGVFYSFHPSISVDGDKIVIAWSGNQSTDDYWHMSPYDIYYVTSKDGGKTWAKPLKVTDTAKDGIRTSGPQVAVQNGVIHLFYVQGREDRHLSRQAPWPIYHQQRPFPD